MTSFAFRRHISDDKSDRLTIFYAYEKKKIGETKTEIILVSRHKSEAVDMRPRPRQ